jgi:Cof subfamily protein (haloacid dehalogenase superfamily)
VTSSARRTDLRLGGVLPALVATDLDGTLLRPDGSVSRRTAAALQAAESAGVVVVMVTGRPPRWLAPVAEQVGHTGVAVCANGAVVYDLHAERVVETFAISREVVLEVVAAVRAAVPEVAFAVEDVDLGYGREQAYVRRPVAGAPPEEVRVASLEDLVDGTIVKLLVRHEGMDSDRLLAAAREVAGELAELTHSSSSGLLEISATGVTKASTLARLAAEQGVDAAEVVAFGDMPNDLPMLAWAGTSYAMADAHPTVIQASQHVAGGHEDDGVARALAMVFGL